MKIMNREINMILVAILIITIGSLNSCKKLSSYDIPGPATAYGILIDDVTFSYFRLSVDRLGLKEMLNGSEAFTVFAPTNRAFANAGFNSTKLRELPIDLLETLIKNHIVPGKVAVSSLNDQAELTSTNGFKMTIQKVGEAAYVDGGDITSSDAETTNGYFNVINNLLSSANTLNDAIHLLAERNDSYTLLPAAIAHASMGSTDFTAIFEGSTPYTFLAPSDDAFEDAGFESIGDIQAADPDSLGDILKYHIIAGARFTTAFDSLPVDAFNGKPIYFDRIKEYSTSYWYANGISFGNGRLSNVQAENGVLHTIPRLLPAPVSTNSLTLIHSNDSLSLFSAIIDRASEVDTQYNFKAMLSDPNLSYTVFAVTNAGLREAGYANEAAIEAASPEILAKLMRFHIIPKRINNINIQENGGVQTLLVLNSAVTGEDFNAAITFIKENGFKVKGRGNAQTISVITGNVVTTNGLVNIIGSVLLPAE